MSYDLRRDAEFLMINPDEFSAVVTQQAAARLLTEALVFAPDHTIIARTPLTLALELERVSQEDLDRARGGEIIIRNNESFDRVRALLYIGGSLDAFLYVGRLVDADVLNHMIKTQQAKNEYNLLESRRSDIEFSLTLMFLVVAFLLVLVAIWVGLSFVTRLAASVRSLMTAAEQVRMGNLKTRVNETISISKELTPLTRAFNRMTSQLEGQQQELLRANQELDQRRQVTESILSGVSVGVVAIDSNGLVTLHNPSAAEYLGTNDTVGKQLTDLLPEVEPLLKTAQSRQNEFYEEHMTVMRKGYVHTFIVRFVAESEGRYIVTFDDITELLQAQRKAAWGDVARRIAHEIKNPLTPIQLSAERLKRKYAPEIKTDPEIFAQCTDTIIRQVSGIGRMVDEFSHFARMPAAVFKMEDLSKLSQQMILLQSPAHPGIEFSLVTEQSVMVNCDGRLIAQAVTNLLQNAIDAIEGNDRPAPVPKGWIELRVKLEDQFVLIAVSDNGKGLPTEGRERLTEPYVTTRRKGTGLGLAIVKKIMEDHQGTLILADRPDGGSVVTLNFRRDL
jgi:two-component system nitrogen regulation sensor histidine kinase NtrY